MLKVKLVLSGLALLLAQSVFAQNTGNVTSVLSASRVTVHADGKETAEPVKAIKPGETLEYVAEYRNGGKDEVKNLEATLPIPTGTEYVPGSAKPADLRASIDGTAFEPAPLKRKVKRADGKVIEQLVPYAEYRFLRWNPQDLPVGKSLKFSARVKVVAEGPVTPAPAKKQ